MWKLKVNLSKTKVVVFNSQTNKNLSFHLGGQPIEISKSYKYLGVIFSKSGNFLQARKHIVDQAKKAMNLLFIRSNNLDLPIDLQIKLFDNTVLPILMYGCEVFGYENTDILEAVHLDFLRKTAKLRKNTPRYMIYAEFGRYPLNITIKQRMINFWARILNGKVSKFSYKIYCYMLHTTDHDFKWTNYIHSILNEIGRPDMWLSQSNSIPLTAGRHIKRILVDQFHQSWNGLLQETDSSKSKNYALFKDNANAAKFLSILSGPSARTMIKFRSGNHKLPIEVGRWNDTDLQERKCNLCQTSSIGDEMHYILECPFFQAQRKALVDQYYYKRPNILKYKELLNTEKRAKLIKLAKFMKIIMESFK